MKNKALSLLPILLFLVLFIGTGIVLSLQGMDMAFYQLSATVAILPAIIFALMQGNEKFHDKINVFISGVGDSNIITMCLIYILAGAFATVASEVGGVQATVNFGLSIIPPSIVLPAIFVIAAFVATAMGTSMGTIAAIAPIALGIAEQSNIDLPLIIGVVVGGAMFGDNLSMISDTTIAATRTQDCEMKDKFILNFKIVTPIALFTIIILYFVGSGAERLAYQDYDFIKVIPYIVILGLAVIGVNVFIVLMTGILLCGIVGFIYIPDYTVLIYATQIYKGFSSMNEIMILSMLIGGLGQLMSHHGGIDYLLEKVNAVSKKIARSNKTKAGEFCIALLVGLADLCTANNTVAIILTGKVAKEIAANNGVDKKRSASLLDMTSCAVQGLIPYSAQLLLAGSIAGLSPLLIVTNNWYCMLLILAVFFSIAFNKKKGSAIV